MKKKLSAAEIRELFDAISLDMNDDIDQDLGDMVGESFEKAIQRSRSVGGALEEPKAAVLSPRLLAIG